MCVSLWGGRGLRWSTIVLSTRGKSFGAHTWDEFRWLFICLLSGGILNRLTKVRLVRLKASLNFVCFKCLQKKKFLTRGWRERWERIQITTWILNVLTRLCVPLTDLYFNNNLKSFLVPQTSDQLEIINALLHLQFLQGLVSYQPWLCALGLATSECA